MSEIAKIWHKESIPRKEVISLLTQLRKFGDASAASRNVASDMSACSEMEAIVRKFQLQGHLCTRQLLSDMRLYLCL